MLFRSLEDEAEGEEVVEQVLEEIGVDLRQAVSPFDIIVSRPVLIRIK